MSTEANSYADFPFNLMWLTSSQLSGAVGFLLLWVWSLARGLCGSHFLQAVHCGMGTEPGQTHGWHEQSGNNDLCRRLKHCTRVARTGYSTPDHRSTRVQKFCLVFNHQSVKASHSQPPDSMTQTVLIFWSVSSSFQVFLYCLAFRLTDFSFGAPTMAGWPPTLATSFLAMSSVADSASCFYRSPISTLTASKCPETTVSSKLRSQAEVSVGQLRRPPVSSTG